VRGRDRGRQGVRRRCKRCHGERARNSRRAQVLPREACVRSPPCTRSLERSTTSQTATAARGEAPATRRRARVALRRESGEPMNVAPRRCTRTVRHPGGCARRRSSDGGSDTESALRVVRRAARHIGEKVAGAAASPASPCKDPTSRERAHARHRAPVINIMRTSTRDWELVPRVPAAGRARARRRRGKPTRVAG